MDTIERDKVVKQIGDSLGFYFNKEERNIYDMKPGDVFSINAMIKKREGKEIKVIRKKRKENKK